MLYDNPDHRRKSRVFGGLQNRFILMVFVVLECHIQLSFIKYFNIKKTNLDVF